ncbi:MAG TPA: hypothetical protein VD864_18410 [Nocardioides sp.]|nr:hypothetical protein [Nocardioides sp.]
MTARRGSRVRVRVVQVVWLLAVLCALVLAVGALCIALDTNRDNALVALVLDAADVVDVEVFSRGNGIFKFEGGDAETKNALANWGLGAVAYLVVGRVLERLVRP